MMLRDVTVVFMRGEKLSPVDEVVVDPVDSSAEGDTLLKAVLAVCSIQT